MKEGQREELSAKIMIVILFTGAQQYFREEVHILCPGLTVTRIEERQMREKLCECLFLCLAV